MGRIRAGLVATGSRWRWPPVRREPSVLFRRSPPSDHVDHTGDHDEHTGNGDDDPPLNRSPDDHGRSGHRVLR